MIQRRCALRGRFARRSTRSGPIKAQPAVERVATRAARSGIGQADMYHIFAAQCHMTIWCVATGSAKPRTPRLRASVPTRQAWSSLRLPSSPASAAWSSSWQLAPRARAASICSEPVRSAPARDFEAEAIERRRSQRRFDQRPADRRGSAPAGLEGPRERALELALGDARFRASAPVDADPRAAAGRLGADIGQDMRRRATARGAHAVVMPRGGAALAAMQRPLGAAVDRARRGRHAVRRLA